MVRWSVGGDPRAPCCSRWESLQVACLPRLSLLQVPVVASMLLPQPSEDVEPHCNWGGNGVNKGCGTQGTLWNAIKVHFCGCVRVV